MVYLIIPPISDCFMPTLGVAQIAGYLKSNHIACRTFDGSAELLHSLLNQQAEQDRAASDRPEKEKYTFKKAAVYLEQYSALHQDMKISVDDFQAGFSWRDLGKLQDYVENETLLSEGLSKLSFVHGGGAGTGEGEQYGFSISYDCQVIPAMLLARIIKKEKPKARIGIGGSLLYNYEHDFYKLMYMTDWIDILIVGAGEEAWKYIGRGEIEKLDMLAGVAVRHVQDRYIIDTRKRKEKPVVYEPDFSDFNFEYYLSKEKAFPYMIKDRCYYGKCYFCNGDKVEEQSIVKDIKTAFERMHKIAELTGIRNIYIVDAALSPKDLKAVAGLPDMELYWVANGRFEKGLTDEKLIETIARRGCVMLRFGLESASQKVLDYMNKGTKVSVAEKVLKLTAQYGIKNHVYLMFGYPGETKEDREMTIEFMKRNREVISSYSVSLFQPIPGTVVYEELLKEVKEEENVYEKMIQLIYKDEFYYEEIYADISRLNDVLRGYVKTNAEFYSANIFNQFEDDRELTKTELPDQKEHIATKEEIQKEISIQFLPENKL